MIRPTRNNIVCIFVVLFLLGISSFFMLFPKTEKHDDKQVRAPSQTRSQDPLPETAELLPGEILKESENDPIERSQETAELLLGADDAEIQRFLDNLPEFETPKEFLDFTHPFLAAYMNKKRMELGLPESSRPPRREDFSSDTDYYKVRLDFYQKKLSEAEGTEYQETFESIIGSIERDIADEEAWIAGSEERRKEKLLDAEKDDDWLERRALIAGLEALPEADRDFFLKYVLPNIKSDGTLILPIDVSEPSGSPPVSVFPVPSIENRVSVSVPIPEKTKLPGEKLRTAQIGSLHDELIKAYPDIFAYPDIKSREVFSELLPSEGSRQYFRHRQTALHKEYAALLDGQLKSVSKQNREQAIETAHQSLLQKWDSDFVDSVIKQLQLTDE